MITSAALLEDSGLQQLHKQQSQDSWKGISSTASERIWGQTKVLLEWVSHSHQIHIRNACFLSPLSQARGLPLPHCPGHVHCHPWGDSTSHWFVRTVGVNSENPSHVNQPLVIRDTVTHRFSFLQQLSLAVDTMPSAHQWPLPRARRSRGRCKGKTEVNQILPMT